MVHLEAVTGAEAKRKFDITPTKLARLRRKRERVKKKLNQSLSPAKRGVDTREWHDYFRAQTLLLEDTYRTYIDEKFDGKKEHRKKVKKAKRRSQQYRKALETRDEW
jgi:hypothetical protein